MTQNLTISATVVPPCNHNHLVISKLNNYTPDKTPGCKPKINCMSISYNCANT